MTATQIQNNFWKAIENMSFECEVLVPINLSEIDNLDTMLTFLYRPDYTELEIVRVQSDSEPTVEYFEQLIIDRRRYTIANELMSL